MSSTIGRIEFAFDRRHLLPPVLLSAVAVVCGGVTVFFIGPDVLTTEAEPFGQGHGYTAVLALITFVIGLGATVATTALYTRTGPGLIVDHVGIEDRSRLLSTGPVGWNDLTWREVESSDGVVVNLSPELVDAVRQRWWPLRYLRGIPVGVAFANLDTDRAEILTAFERFGAGRRLAAAEVRTSAVDVPVEVALAVEGTRGLGWRHKWIWLGVLVGVAVLAGAGIAVADLSAKVGLVHLSVLAASILLIGVEAQRVVARKSDEIVAAVVMTDTGRRELGWLTPSAANDRAHQLRQAGLPAVAHYHAAAVGYWVAVQIVGASAVAAGVVVRLDEVGSHVDRSWPLIIVGAGLLLLGPAIPRWVKALAGRGAAAADARVKV